MSFHHADPQPELNEEARQLGLEPRYVYRVTQVADLGQGRQIVRVKNCSGWTEPMWCGSWSPDDTNWANVSDAIRRELDGEAFHDGGFWIGFQVRTNFTFQITCLWQLTISGLPEIFRHDRFLSH